MIHPTTSDVTAQQEVLATRATTGKSFPRWAAWLLPSIADVFFLVLSAILLFSPGPSPLLRDADTGWHIRNGEQILQTRSIPRVDSFSATMAGHTWYSWEWLWDLTMGAIHQWAGLNGIVVVNAVLIAFVFALLFRLILKRTSNFLTAAVLACLAAFASQIHMLARPHLVSWLLTLLWLHLLYLHKSGKARALMFLPFLMLLWVNLHGGFIIGFALLFIFAVADLWTMATASSSEARGEAGHSAFLLGSTALGCGIASLGTPYGYKLHAHVFGYLSSSFLMNHIQEFLSPDFHLAPAIWFELLIFVIIVAAIVSRQKAQTTELLVVLFAIHSGLYAKRNIPIAVIMMSFAASPLVASALAKVRNVEGTVGGLGGALQNFSTDLAAMERRFRGHFLAIIVAICLFAIAIHGGRIGSVSFVDATFDGSRFPVRAADFIEKRTEVNPVFTTDTWSGYLIYRLYPQHRLLFDDRHDFYGESKVREYINIVTLEPGWQQVLGRWGANWVLMNPNSALANALKISPDWTVVYDDGTAVLFTRRDHVARF